MGYDIDVTIPGNNDIISQHPAAARAFRQTVQDLLGDDHDEGASGSGHHKKVTLLEQGADPGPAANEMALYTKLADGQSELFLQNEGGGDVIQLTQDSAWIPHLVRGNKAARTAITNPVDGMMFIRTDIFPGAIEVYESSAWVRRAGPSIGDIILWSGNVAVTGGYLDDRDGWALCDGSTVNGFATPNLKGRFIVGYDSGDADYNAIGDVGGSKEHQLTEDEMPSHTHTVGQGNNVAIGDYMRRVDNLTESRNTGATGGDQPHENRPPYYTLAYIVFVDVA